MAALVGTAAIGVQLSRFGAGTHDALARACGAAAFAAWMKRLYQGEILLARLPLDARRDIDESGAGQHDGLADGVGGEPTRQGEGRFRGCERAPVEGDAVAAGERGPGRRF